MTDCQKTSPYRPNKGHDKHFSVPVLDQSVSISGSLVPGPALCPGAGAAERPQEILYLFSYELDDYINSGRIFCLSGLKPFVRHTNAFIRVQFNAT